MRSLISLPCVLSRSRLVLELEYATPLPPAGAKPTQYYTLVMTRVTVLLCIRRTLEESPGTPADPSVPSWLQAEPAAFIGNASQGTTVVQMVTEYPVAAAVANPRHSLSARAACMPVALARRLCGRLSRAAATARCAPLCPHNVLTSCGRTLPKYGRVAVAAAKASALDA